MCFNSTIFLCNAVVSFESTIYRVNERDSEVSVCLVLRTMGDLLEPITLTVALTTVGSTAVGELQHSFAYEL